MAARTWAGGEASTMKCTAYRFGARPASAAAAGVTLAVSAWFLVVAGTMLMEGHRPEASGRKWHQVAIGDAARRAYLLAFSIPKEPA
jgi:hypothetical protein